MMLWKSVAVVGLLFPALAMAQAVPAEQAAQMLARAQSVDVKCSYLAPAAKDEMSKLVAKAELALAMRESVEATKATMERGHAEGLAATCDADEKQNLAMILGAARDAQAGASPVQPAALKETVPAAIKIVVPDPTPEPPVAAPPSETPPPVLHLKAKHKISLKVASPAPKRVRSDKSNGGLGQYARLTQAYFVARRCAADPHTAGSLHQSIVAMHGRLMRDHSAREVAGVLHGSEARASASNCF